MVPAYTGCPGKEAVKWACVCEMYLVNTGSHPHTVAVSCVHCDVVLVGDDHDHEMSVQPLMKRSGVLVATMLQQLVWAKCVMWQMH